MSAEDQAAAALARHESQNAGDPFHFSLTNHLYVALRDLLASRVSTPPSEVSAVLEALAAKYLRAAEGTDRLTRYGLEVAARLLTEEAAAFRAPVPAVPVPPTEPGDDIESLRRTAQRLRAEHDLSSALEIEAVIREREAAPTEPEEKR